MANLLGQNIGTNYKGILSLDSTINTPLDATLRAVTDGDGNASPLQLSTTSITNLGAGAVASNTAFGNNALDTNSTGASNSAFGNNASTSITTGSNNTSLGFNALALNVTANANTAIGSNALSKATTSNNTAVGNNSLTNFFAGGDQNTALGHQSGVNIATSGNGTFIGYNSGVSVNNGTNSVFLGASANGQATTTSATILGQGTSGRTGCVVIGQGATATADNQFVVGSAGVNAGAVTVESNTSANVWNVVINGVARKILLA